MSLNFQPSVTLAELTLFAQTEIEGESSELLDSLEMPDKPECLLKSGAKEYKFSESGKLPLSSKTILNYLSDVGSKIAKNSTPSQQAAQVKSEILKTQIFSKAEISTKGVPNQEASPTSQQTKINVSANAPQKNVASQEGKKAEAAKSSIPAREASSRDQKAEATTNRFSITSKGWCHQETKNFWENRISQQKQEQRERQQGQGQGKQDQEEQNQKDKKNAVQKVAGASDSFSNSQERDNKSAFEKPILERPKTGIFALYFILTKIGIFSDGSSNSAYKKEIEAIDEETTGAHKQRLAEIKKALDKEKSARRWSIAEKIFSWLGSLFGIIAGAVLIATGAGAAVGAMMICAGVLQITNQILEMTGAWHKIAELLPGDDIEKKRAVVSWMQIGIALLSIILAGAGIIWGGYSNFSEALQIAQSAVGAVAMTGHGVTTIGQGISTYHYKDKFGESKKYEKRLAELKHIRDDLMDKVDFGVDRLERLFEDLSHALEFEVELFRAEQMINR